MQKKTIFITGATDGIGKQTALELAAQGHAIIIHGRDEAKCAETAHLINEETGNTDVHYYMADFGDFDEVREMAKKIKGNLEELDVLINNAGIYKDKRALTVEGIETQFAVNHLAPFLLTIELLPLLKNTSGARIVNVASQAHYRGDIDFDNLNGEKEYDGYQAYAQSKLANILFTYELAERLSDDNITVNTLHPGVIDTKLLREGFGMKGESLKKGAETSIYLAVSDDVENVTGKYFDNCKEKKSSDISYDEEKRKKLWEKSLAMTGVQS